MLVLLIVAGPYLYDAAVVVPRVGIGVQTLVLKVAVIQAHVRPAD
jgi:hypothetical protein